MTLGYDPAKILQVERLVGAPIELVFRMFSDARHLDQWWGPDGFQNETHEMDFSVGGLWRYTMHGPDGKDWPNWIRYQDITPPTRIAYQHGAEMGEPAHFDGVITLQPEGTGTRVTLTLIFATPEARDATLKFGAVEGGKQTLARLDTYAMAQKNA
ncbi:SRPBCC family protein [Rhizobium sp. AAP43]|uniref:SRPBCC family protein n=1 Tax=Rhizobium sp. AAP43 TaxID=1523420 RepID=UPI0006B920E6|nr:SRPBCC family protein [Rhizobium sp. AAP43]KPF45451.1 ATPase [Rhizobium sp. AAP43]